jgi:hypothetical protein
MAVHQSPEDPLPPVPSGDDPDARLRDLESEVALVKTSIKRLLIDIRERMNELDNPFTLTPAAGRSETETRKGTPDAREPRRDTATAGPEAEKNAGAAVPGPVPAESQPHSPGGEFLPRSPLPQRTTAAPQSEKLRLQKVYKLFKWTHQSVRKFGHDRLDIMLESYRAMGYVTKESCDEIREIARLMPANLGEEHEVGPDEFVAELYALNRILAPGDTSLDRDMIEVMMEQRGQELMVKDSGERTAYPQSSLRERASPVRKDGKDEEWMNLPDRG